MRRRSAVVIAALSATTLAMLVPLTADARPAASSRPGSLAVVRPGPAPATPTAVRPAEVPQNAAALKAAATASFTVSYTGFSTEARAAFQRAVDIWAAKVSSSVPITVAATFTNLGPGVLGAAGSSNIWADFDGAPRAGVWYVDATANRALGRQIDSSPDIVANFNSGFANWYFGTGNAPQGTYDFTTVVLHELGHGLGFIGAADVVGSGASARGSLLISGSPTAYDLATETNAGVGLLRFRDQSAPLASALQGGKVYIDSPAVRRVNGGRPAKLFAPSTFQGGSSYSHLDEATYRAGSVNSLMTPLLGPGETIRDPGPLGLAVLASVGW